MYYSRHHFRPRKSIDDFLAESLPNRILYECIRKNTLLSDETILTAFNEAYQTCIDVLAEPEQQSSLSDNLSSFALNAPLSSLLRLCFTYFLLSFHKEAPSLQHYLSNLKKLLEVRLPEVFQPLMSAASSVVPLFPDSITFTDAPCEPLLERSRDCVKIASLVKKAKELSKPDADILLKALQTVFAEEDSDWKELIRLAIEQNEIRMEPKRTNTIYQIRKGQNTTLIKILKALFDLRIILDDKGFYLSNFEAFAYDVCAFFNAKLKKTPHGTLYDARQTDCYTDVFDKLKELAEADYEKGKALDKSDKKPTVKEHPQGSISF